MILSQYLAPSRPVNGSTAIHSAVTKHGKLITLVAGKWQGLLLRGEILSAVTKHGKLITLVAGKWQGLLLRGDDDEVFVTRISTLHQKRHSSI